MVKKIIIVVFAFALVCATVAIGVKVSKLESDRTVSASEYQIGLLDDLTGKLPSHEDDVDKGGISTTNFINISGLKCELAKNAEIKYQINWYTSERQFISVKTLTSDYDTSTATDVPTTAQYCKIEIIPLDDNDGTVGMFEKNKYAKLLTVTIDK